MNYLWKFFYQSWYTELKRDIVLGCKTRKKKQTPQHKTSNRNQQNKKQKNHFELFDQSKGTQNARQKYCHMLKKNVCKNKENRQ